MGKAALCLLLCGVLLEAAGFAVSNDDEIPVVLRFVEPGYSRAAEGLATLESGTELVPGMKEFDECAELHLTMFREQAPPRIADSLAVVRFVHPPSVIHLFNVRRGVLDLRPLEVYLSTGEEVDSSLESLSKKIDKLRGRGLFRLSALVFAAGVVLSIGSAAVEASVRGKSLSER